MNCLCIHFLIICEVIFPQYHWCEHIDISPLYPINYLTILKLKRMIHIYKEWSPGLHQYQNKYENSWKSRSTHFTLKFQRHNLYINVTSFQHGSNLYELTMSNLRDHYVYVPSQWEMALQCNPISHWLGTYIEWSLKPFFFIIHCGSAHFPFVGIYHFNVICQSYWLTNCKPLSLSFLIQAWCSFLSYELYEGKKKDYLHSIVLPLMASSTDPKSITSHVLFTHCCNTVVADALVMFILRSWYGPWVPGQDVSF